MSHIEEDNCTGSNVKEFSALAQFLFIHVLYWTKTGKNRKYIVALGRVNLRFLSLGTFMKNCCCHLFSITTLHYTTLLMEAILWKIL